MKAKKRDNIDKFSRLDFLARALRGRYFFRLISFQHKEKKLHIRDFLVVFFNFSVFLIINFPVLSFSDNEKGIERDAEQDKGFSNRI